jgi:hypothetical protein
MRTEYGSGLAGAGLNIPVPVVAEDVWRSIITWTFHIAGDMMCFE